MLHWLHTYLVLLAKGLTGPSRPSNELAGPSGPTRPTGPTGPTRTTRSTGLTEHNRTTRPTGPAATESLPQSIKKILKCVTVTFITLPFAFKYYQLNIICHF